MRSSPLLEQIQLRRIVALEGDDETQNTRIGTKGSSL
jgi:hypothetical protein